MYWSFLFTQPFEAFRFTALELKRKYKLSPKALKLFKVLPANYYVTIMQ